MGRPAATLRLAARVASRWRTTRTLSPWCPLTGTVAPNTPVAVATGAARKVRPCLPMLRKISFQGIGMPARDSSRAPSNTAQASAVCGGHRRRSTASSSRPRAGSGTAALPCGVNGTSVAERRADCSAGSSPMVRAAAKASSCMRRSVSRAMAPPSCTRAVPWLSATWRKRSPAYSDRPPATSSTIATSLPASHQRRRVVAGSIRSRSSSALRRFSMGWAFSAACSRGARPAS